MSGVFRSIFNRNKATIGKNSNQNTILQNSVVSNPIFCTTNSELLKALGSAKAYDAIQHHAQDYFASLKQTHPLYPVFSATPSKNFDSLVSTPETEDAFKLYPKKIKGEFLLDYNKYPHLNKNETPWEYAYRTQSYIELETTAYQEYLGDIEDPFPNIKYTDGMKMIIGFPEFPPAVDAVISSGDITVPFLMRRKPWMEYGQMCFGTVSGECGLNIKIIAFKDTHQTEIKISKEQGLEFDVLLQREQLLSAMLETKKFSISVNGSHLVTVPIEEESLNADMFQAAKFLVRYYDTMLSIEDILHCRFDRRITDVSFDDFRAASIILSSLREKWYRMELDFDDELRCDYDHIPNEIQNTDFDISQWAITVHVLGINLHGLKLKADSYSIIYDHAKINNIQSVLGNIKRHRKNILITFRPLAGRNKFDKYCRLEGIGVLD